MRIKKTISLSFAILVLFTTLVSPIYASKDSSPLPSWFTNAIKPIQNSINSLLQRTNNHETRITELEKKVNFEVPTQWNAEFYEVLSPPETKVVMSPANNCTWNGSIIDSHVTARAIAHLSTGDMYGVGACREITFKSNVILVSGATFETDIYLWWQGKEKHTKQTVAIPERPFRSLLTVNNGGSLLISPSSNGMLTIQGTGALGIGTTSANSIQIDCSSWNCNSDLLKINN